MLRVSRTTPEFRRIMDAYFAAGEKPQQRAPVPRKRPKARMNDAVRLLVESAPTCWLCGLGEWGRGGSSRSWDHVKPRSLGGSDALGNAAVAHQRCNTLRGSVYDPVVDDARADAWRKTFLDPQHPVYPAFSAAQRAALDRLRA